MRYISIEELTEPSEEAWQRVEAGEEFVVTRDGKAFALLVRTDAQALEEQLRALRLLRLGDVVRRIQAHAAASGADQLTEEEIQAEIDAVRRDAAAKAAKSGLNDDR